MKSSPPSGWMPSERRLIRGVWCGCGEVGDTDPTGVYAGCWPADWPASSLPPRFRQRWACQERRIRELVNGANLNANFGYTATLVPNRTQQRRWAEAQAKVEVTEAQMAEQCEAVTNLTGQLMALTQATQETEQELAQQIADQEALVKQRQAAPGCATRWCRPKHGLRGRWRGSGRPW